MDYSKHRTPERVEKIAKVLAKRQKDFTVVFENIHDPHNVSACIRSCDAVGIYGVHFVYNSGQSFPKLGEKSSASGKKWMKLNKHKSVVDCFEKLKSEGKKIYTTHLSSDAVSIYDIDLTEPSALVLGNEHLGVSDEALGLADANIIIPQVGMIQSLNISVACAVSVYEAFRQREAKKMYDINQFSEEEFEQELNNWLTPKWAKKLKTNV